METITTFSTNKKKMPAKQKEVLAWLNTYEADEAFVKTNIQANSSPDSERAIAWAKTIARKFELDWDTFENFGLSNPAMLLPQTVVRNVLRTLEGAGVLSKITTFENEQRLDWNILVRDDFANPEAWTTKDNAHIWALIDEETSTTFKLEGDLKIINIQLNPGFVYKFTRLPRRLTVLHPQLVGMVLQDMANEVVRAIESGICWGEVLQTDDATSNYDWLKPIDPTQNGGASANRVFTVTPSVTTSILPIISTVRLAYAFWNGQEQPPHIIMNRTAWRELYTELLAKLQSFSALMNPIKAVLGYTKEEIEKEMGIQITIVPDYNMQDDPFMQSGATAKFIVGDMKAYGALFPSGRSESFSFFKLDRNEIELLNEVLIAGDVIDIAKLFYCSYPIPAP